MLHALVLAVAAANPTNFYTNFNADNGVYEMVSFYRNNKPTPFQKINGSECVSVKVKVFPFDRYGDAVHILVNCLTR